jgi:hypothetical protein
VNAHESEDPSVAGGPISTLDIFDCVVEVVGRYGHGGAVGVGSWSDICLHRRGCASSMRVFGLNANDSRLLSRSSGAEVLMMCWIRVELTSPILSFAWMKRIVSPL